jgi:hypothetical protein
VNSANWLRGSSYVEIDHGEVTLRRWDRKRGVVDIDLVALGGD